MLKRIGALTFGLAAGILLLELALRLVDAIAPPSMPPELRPVPSSAPIVSSWSTGAEPGSRPRILVVGDSFTVGRGVPLDRVYSARLAAHLAALGQTAEVVSLSFPGWNTRAEAAAIAREIDALAPDLLILGHCLNDVEKRPTGEATAGRQDLRPWQPEGPVESFLDAHSRLFSRGRRALDTLRLRPLLRAYYVGLYDDKNGRRRWRKALRAIHRTAAERAIQVVLVVFPIFDSDPDREYPYRTLHAIVGDAAEELGYRTLDLLGSYEGMSGRDLALVPFTDSHPSALAHEIAGREIARYLEANNLLSDLSLAAPSTAPVPAEAPPPGPSGL